MNMKDSFAIAEEIHILSCHKLHHFHNIVERQWRDTPSAISPGVVSWVVECLGPAHHFQWRLLEHIESQ